MTLAQLGALAADDLEVATGDITLTPDEARAIVGQAVGADERCHALAAGHLELEAENTRLKARIAELEAQAEETRLALAAALEGNGARA